MIHSWTSETKSLSRLLHVLNRMLFLTFIVWFSEIFFFFFYGFHFLRDPAALEARRPRYLMLRVLRESLGLWRQLKAVSEFFCGVLAG
jgi:hypothetical protein